MTSERKETKGETMFDINKFVTEPGIGRGPIEKPFNLNGYTFATDGRVLVRCPLDPKYDGNYSGLSLKEFAFELPAAFDVVTFETPEIHEKREFKCQKCNGAGKYTDKAPCPRCEGTGQYYCKHCGEESDCKDCDGTGKIHADGESIPCYHCKRTGDDFKTPVAVAGRHYSHGYMMLLVRAFGSFELENRTDFQPAQWRANQDGVEYRGYIMPMRVP